MHDQSILWNPSEEFVQNSNLKKFESWLKSNKSLSFDDYQSLWSWSVDNIEDFWESIWQYNDIISHSDYNSVVSGDQMPGIRWFDGSTLNYAEHVFRNKTSDHPAIYFKNEFDELKTIEWEELESKVSELKKYLLEVGIQKGDFVAGYLPNIPEAIVAFLATNALGAIWTCCSPDFGVTTVIDRFKQVKPKLLIAANGYQYNGKLIHRENEIELIQNGIKSIEGTVIIPYLKPKRTNFELSNLVLWNDIFTGKPDKLEFVAVDFNHPIWVLYSSGTTGKPKAITHSHGGVLLEHLKYMHIQNDVKPGENFFWFTTTGWMMWNFLQASLLVGAVPVLYDGSPGKPDLNVLWELTEQLPIHHFGTSAPYLVACMKEGLEPKGDVDLSALRSIGSTGAPLPPEAFEWVYKNVSEKVWLCSMSGGTDVCTAFVGGIVDQPVYKGYIQGRALGVSLYAYDEDGEKVEDSLGEMVLEKPMPSMPVCFWNDPDNERYKSSYFEKFEGKWCHGDWISIKENGSLIIQGRSDATLNRKGIRIGTAEIYAVLDRIEGIKDSLIVNLEKSKGDDIMPLFLVSDPGFDIEEIKIKVRQYLRKQCSPRHVPDVIILVKDIPYTLSGKKMEIPVKKALLGMDVSKSVNPDAVKNPEAMEFFIDYQPVFKKLYLND